MPITIARVPIHLISEPEGSLNTDSTLIMEHLVRYLRRCDELPAVTLRVDEDDVTISRGHTYLQAAKALDRETIRAVVQPANSAGAKALLAHPDVTVLDWHAVQKREAKTQRPRGWHVFYFARPLTEAERTAFEDRIVLMFGQKVAVSFDDTGPCAEFEAETPVNDGEWSRQYLDVVRGFSDSYVKVVSFQGRRFAAGS